VADPYAFTIVAQNSTVEYLGGTNTQPVVVVGVVTAVHNIYFEVRIPQAEYSATPPKAVATGYVPIYEDIANLPNVADVAWGQRTNASGLLVDQVTIIVQSASGLSTAQLGPIDVVNLGTTDHESEINALSKELTDGEGAGG